MYMKTTHVHIYEEDHNSRVHGKSQEMDSPRQGKAKQGACMGQALEATGKGGHVTLNAGIECWVRQRQICVEEIGTLFILLPYGNSS